MFNTGDLGKWRKGGSLDILGRADDQVKIKVSILNILYELLINSDAGLPSGT